MKKFIKALLIVSLIAVSALGLLACTQGQGKGAKSGLYVKQYSGDDFYTVYDCGSDFDGDIAKYATDNNVTIGRIKAGAFEGNSTITDIIVPSTVTVIDGGAFRGMTALEEITLPFIGKTAKADAYLGESKDADDKSVDAERTFCYIFGTEEYDGGASVTANYGASTATYYLPKNLDTVKINAAEGYSLPMYAFSGVKGLYKVQITGAKAIGAYAFENCESLMEVTLPATVKNIYEGAFSGTTNLKQISFEGLALDSIGDKAFKGAAVTELKIAVANIGNEAFVGSKLEKLEVTNALSIGNNAFRSCEKLAEVKVTVAAGQTLIEGIDMFDADFDLNNYIKL